LVGFHAHDNLKNASVKAIDALYNGAAIIDVTFGGFGRGSGNAISEYVLAHMEKGLGFRV
jgi:isopropylmalate/homocitrate/citramalate synthase